MNKTEREPYLILCNFPEEGWGLCNACKFAEWNGSSCCDGSLECHHPLPVINDEEHPDEVWGFGHDCWGFRPDRTLQDVGIMASIRAMGFYPQKVKGEWVALVPSFKVSK